MRLENLLALTHGKLVNEPFVNSFSNVIFEAKNIKRGDIFVAFDETAIEEAVFNGAYGILFSKPTQIRDNEIAWIKVENLEDALVRLLRFRLLDKEIVVYEADEIMVKLAHQVMSDLNFIVLEGDICSLFKALWAIQSGSVVLFSPTLTSVDLFTKTRKPSKNPPKTIHIVEQTLFETSFVYEDIYYERQSISPYFIPYLEMLFYLFKSEKTLFRLRKFTPLDHFEASFINRNFEIKEFGTTDRVLIFEKSYLFVESQMLFLQKEASWAKLLYILPESYTGHRITNFDSIFFYKNEREIMPLLKKHSFHFALIVGVDKYILKAVAPKHTQLTLDF